MLSEKMQEALNKQLQEEISSAYIYLSMSACFEDLDLPGMAAWMRAQHDEEMLHAMKFFDYINSRGGRVELQAIPAPQKEWKDALDIFTAAYNHELHITGCIHNLVKLSREEVDIATETFLQWFVTEQVEEETTADAIVKNLKRVGNSSEGLFMLDRELGARGTAKAL